MYNHSGERLGNNYSGDFKMLVNHSGKQFVNHSGER